MGNLCSRLCSCCGPKLPTFRINIISDCCKTDSEIHDVVIHNENDLDKIRELIKVINHKQSIKVSKSEHFMSVMV